MLISTVSVKGISNAAPFSFVMPVSSKPPLAAFASQPTHDTVRNIDETKDFVLNIPGRDILNELWATAKKLPPDVSEFTKAHLTEQKSVKVKSPGIKECIARFECKFTAKYPAGDHDIIIGEVLHTDVTEKYFPGNDYQISEANPLMHISGPDFGLLGEIVRPG